MELFVFELLQHAENNLVNFDLAPFESERDKICSIYLVSEALLRSQTSLNWQLPD